MRWIVRLEDDYIHISAPLPKKHVRHVKKKRKTDRELKMAMELGGYEMQDLMLNLGSYVNILPKKTWELMGRPRLVWSPIQLRLANQYKIYPVGWVENVEVNIDGVKTKAYFEVIDIMDEKDPYPAFIGIDWAFYNKAVFNLKQRKISFETEELHVVAPLDPTEGDRFTEPINDDV
jgi:hypothetical protein